MRTVDQVGSFVAKHKFWLLALGMGLLPACQDHFRSILPSLF